MCQIIIKPANQVIHKKLLREIWSSNGDGAGFMYNHKGKVIIHKGFMAFKQLWKALKPFQDKEIVIHLRYATHGLKNKHMTHPFPLDNSNGDNKIICNKGIVHNGIIGNYGNDFISDTYDYIQKELFNRSLEVISYKISKLTSKFAVLDGYDLYTYGEFYELDGLEYSTYPYYSYHEHLYSDIFDKYNNFKDVYKYTESFYYCDTCGSNFDDCMDRCPYCDGMILDYKINTKDYNDDGYYKYI